MNVNINIKKKSTIATKLKSQYQTIYLPNLN